MPRVESRRPVRYLDSIQEDCGTDEAQMSRYNKKDIGPSHDT